MKGLGRAGQQCKGVQGLSKGLCSGPFQGVLTFKQDFQCVCFSIVK
jgi:hypothetical protein